MLPVNVDGREGVPRSGEDREGASTDAGCAGGPVRRSGDVLGTGAERRSRVVRGCVRSINRKFSGRSRVDQQKAPDKPFVISKRAVWEAWEKVRANKGAPGADGVSLGAFESDLKNNLFKIWNRMSSGSYFPPPVRAVEIPKAHGRASECLVCRVWLIG